MSEVRERLNQKSQAFIHVFNSPEGKKVLEALEKEFYHGELLGESPDKTAYNLGRRDVVMYIKQMLVYGERNE